MSSLVGATLFVVVIILVVAVARKLGRLASIRTALDMASAAPLTIVLLFALLASVYGHLGAGYGVPKLVWHEREEFEFFGGAAVAALAGQLWLAFALISHRGASVLAGPKGVVDRLTLWLNARLWGSNNAALSDYPSRRFARYLTFGYLFLFPALAVPAAAVALGRPDKVGSSGQIDNWLEQLGILNLPAETYQSAPWGAWLAGVGVGVLAYLATIWGFAAFAFALQTWAAGRPRGDKKYRPVISLRYFDLWERFGSRGNPRASKPVGSGENLEDRQPPPYDAVSREFVRLHLVLSAMAFGVLAVMPIFSSPEIPPVVSVCALLGLLAALYVLLCHENPASQLPAIVIVVVILTVMNGVSLDRSPGSGYFKVRFDLGGGPREEGNDPGLPGSYYDADQYQPLDPRAYIKEGSEKPENEVKAAAGLLEEKAVLDNWLASARAEAERRNGGSVPAGWKPKLVVVTTSGGASLAAVWTAGVLAVLEREFDREGVSLPAHVRLVTGASGGMLGAGYYVALLDEPGEAGYPGLAVRGKAVVDDLSSDFLSPVVRQGVFRDFPTLLCPTVRHRDRGKVLEEAWWRATSRDPEDPRTSPLARPFRSMGPGEQAGWRPSLVFAPMLVEDGRRLLVSNLDLFRIVRNTAPVIGPQGPVDVQPGAENLTTYTSLGGLEFYRVFPGAEDFRLSTAVRMNATFPLISPAVYLPTNPRRRVVDAGYFDNYGVHLAATWLREHRHWLVENTSGVLMIQLRAFADEEARAEFLPSPAKQNPPPEGRYEPQGGSLVAAGAEWATTPMTGFFNSWRGVMSYRNDEQVELLYAIFKDLTKQDPDGSGEKRPDSGRAGAARPAVAPHGVGESDFFRTVVFEAPGGVSMSWYLTDYEERLLRYGIEPDDPKASRIVATPSDSLIELRNRNVEKMEELVKWWKKCDSQAR